MATDEKFNNLTIPTRIVPWAEERLHPVYGWGTVTMPDAAGMAWLSVGQARYRVDVAELTDRREAPVHRIASGSFLKAGAARGLARPSGDSASVGSRGGTPHLERQKYIDEWVSDNSGVGEVHDAVAGNIGRDLESFELAAEPDDVEGEVDVTRSYMPEELESNVADQVLNEQDRVFIDARHLADAWGVPQSYEMTSEERRAKYRRLSQFNRTMLTKVFRLYKTGGSWDAACAAHGIDREVGREWYRLYRSRAGATVFGRPVVGRLRRDELPES